MDPTPVERAILAQLEALGYYARMEDETVTTSLRGFDPTLYSGIDVICLVADGLVRPLIQSPASALPASR